MKIRWNRGAPGKFVDYREVPKVSHKGYSFASKAEASLYDFIKMRELAKECLLIKAQDSVYMTLARILYKPDFKIYDNHLKREVWEEMKGFETDVWRIKRRLWKHYGPGLLRVYKRTKSGPVLSEEIDAGKGIDASHTDGVE